MADKINIEGKEIAIKSVNDQDYISLTDMVRGMPNPSMIIQNWLRPRSTIEFLILWEKIYNPDFNIIESDYIKNEAGGNTFTLSVKNWTERTGAIGIISRAGRYGGTYAHRDIAFEFGTFISPSFRFLLIRDYQRLKSIEYQQQKLEWDTGRFLSKINLPLQTDAIETIIIPRTGKADAPYVYASEADLLNLAVFGMTAKEWREQNPDVKGNIRDGASLMQLIILSNLETHNADYIRAGASKEARYLRLCEIVEHQTKVFAKDKRLNDEKRFIE